MLLREELREAMIRRYPKTVCLGGICYLRMDDETVVKAELVAKSGFDDAVRLTILNRRAGPVDSVTIGSWELPHRAQSAEEMDWDVCRSIPDVDALSELIQAYLGIFQNADAGAR